ncbi:MAG: alanine--tRNA ligase, partial [Marinovum sp.]|nr:alanine--tRNA ligase [Marinovum sp.]
IRANHSATHLLHEALRRRLGDHVAQRGSLNDDDRLRFDFSHAKALSAEDLRAVETEVNAFIRQNTPVETRIMTPDDARGLGAQALFGEKYGDEVRVVSMGHLDGSGKGNDGATYSLELCGGTHVKQTGEIGMFVTTGDSASSAGVRRIEALTGQAAYEHLMAQNTALTLAAAELKSPLSDVPDRVKALLDERKSLSNELAQLRRELALSGGASNGGAEAKDIGGIGFVAQVLSGVSGKELPALIDEHKARLSTGAVLLIAEADGKVAVCAGLTADLTDSHSAVDLVQAAVPLLGGAGGGGRPDLARGGGNDINGAEAAIAAAQQILEGGG